MTISAAMNAVNQQKELKGASVVGKTGHRGTGRKAFFLSQRVSSFDKLGSHLLSGGYWLFCCFVILLFRTTDGIQQTKFCVLRLLLREGRHLNCSLAKKFFTWGELDCSKTRAHNDFFP